MLQVLSSSWVIQPILPHTLIILAVVNGVSLRYVVVCMQVARSGLAASRIQSQEAKIDQMNSKIDKGFREIK
jgi:outer membrane murein-binding lipoprotein Lpp